MIINYSETGNLDKSTPFTFDEGLQIIYTVFRLVFNALNCVYWNDYRQTPSNGDSTTLA